MLRNYFIITIRHLLKNKLFSITNIAGLTIGIACCFLILLFVGYELSFDKWNPNAERIVRPHGDLNFGGNKLSYAVVGSAVAPDAAAVLPEIENWCRFRNYGSSLVKPDGTSQTNIREENILTVDSTFFALFPRQLYAGDSKTCLTRPNTVAISLNIAQKYFGSAPDALGKTILLDNDSKWEVTAVFEEIPDNSHFKAELLLSMVGNDEVANDPPLWAVSNNFHTYFLLREGVDTEAFRQKFIDLSREKLEVTSSQILGMSLADFEATGQYARFQIQKLTDIHLRSSLQVELEPNGSIRYVWIFSGIALFILLIACINFMNLTTAKSNERGHEIGIRKVLGSTRRNLVSQFMGEAILVTALAVLLAVISAYLALPWFVELTGREMNIPWSQPLFWIALLSSTLGVGILAGSYPSVFLSAFDPIKSLQSRFSGQGGHRNLRSVLVVFQFAVATLLIISTFLVYQQLQYVQKKNLGFQKDQIIVVNDAYALGSQVESFKNEMLQNPFIHSATISSYLPIPSSRSNTSYSKSREFRDDNTINMQAWTVDHDYAKTLELEITEGRFFDRAFPSDSNAVVLNETAIGILNYSEPVGKKIYGLNERMHGAPTPEDFIEYTVIGVVRNFHFESLRENISSLGMFLGSASGLVSFHFDANESQQVIADLESKWKIMAPDQPFSYRFVDESFASVYDAEQRIGKIALVFSILAIFVCCLGLFGLSSYVIEQKTKEIGIRKVLGASVSGIVGLLSKDYLKLVIVALVIASPLAWYFMDKWLENFAYRIQISWWVFVLAGMIAIGIAALTVSFQSIKAALANPVNSIQNE